MNYLAVSVIVLSVMFAWLVYYAVIVDPRLPWIQVVLP